MAITEDTIQHETHEVFNQPTPLENYNAFATDQALVEGLRREGAAPAEAELSAFGELTGRADVIKLGFLANENCPSCAPTIVSATASTRWNFTRPGPADATLCRR